MYLRTLKQKNKDGKERTYLQIIESIREGKKVKKRVVANLGRMGQEITEGKIDQVMRSLSKHAGKLELLDILKDLKSKASKEYGELQIYRKVFKDLGIERILKQKLAGTEKQVLSNPHDKLDI